MLNVSKIFGTTQKSLRFFRQSSRFVGTTFIDIMNDPTEETLEVLSRLMVRFANHQGISLNSICEKTGVDVGKYLGTPTKPSVRSLFKFAYGMEMEPACLVLLASKCAKGAIDEADLQRVLVNLKSLDGYLEMAFQMFVGKSSIG